MAATQAAARMPKQSWRGQPARPAAAAAAARARRRQARRGPQLARASLPTAEPSLITLPVFPLNNVLHPAQQGILKGAARGPGLTAPAACGLCGCLLPTQLLHAPTRTHSPPPAAVFEPRYLALFRDLLAENPARGRGGRFVHVLSPASAPPALLDNAVGGLPRIGCCAEVEQIQVSAGAAHAAVFMMRSRLHATRCPPPAPTPAQVPCRSCTLHMAPSVCASCSNTYLILVLLCLQAQEDGTLFVRYSGERRVQLLMVAGEEPYTRVAGALGADSCATIGSFWACCCCCRWLRYREVAGCGAVAATSRWRT